MCRVVAHTDSVFVVCSFVVVRLLLFDLLRIVWLRRYTGECLAGFTDFGVVLTFWCFLLGLGLSYLLGCLD